MLKPNQMRSNWHRHTVMWVELVALYCLPPVVILLDVVPLDFRWVIFLASATYILAVAVSQQDRALALGVKPVDRTLLSVLGGSIVIAALIIGISAANHVGHRQLLQWSLVFVLYPLVSVPAQEVFFRGFFFFRYGDLLPIPMLVCMNAVLFALYHCIFGSVAAVAASLAVGLVLAVLFERTRNLYICMLVHYGFGITAYLLGFAEGFTAISELLS